MFTKRYPILSQALFCRQNKFLSFGFPSSARLSVPHSSSQPQPAPAHFSDRTSRRALGTLLQLCLNFPACSRAVSLKPSYSHVSPDSSPPYVPSKSGASLVQALVTEGQSLRQTLKHQTCPTQKFTALTWTLRVLKCSQTHTSTEPCLLP